MNDTSFVFYQQASVVAAAFAQAKRGDGGATAAGMMGLAASLVLLWEEDETAKTELSEDILLASVEKGGWKIVASPNRDTTPVAWSDGRWMKAAIAGVQLATQAVNLTEAAGVVELAPRKKIEFIAAFMRILVVSDGVPVELTRAEALSAFKSAGWVIVGDAKRAAKTEKKGELTNGS